jgi:hypothetical protein
MELSKGNAISERCAQGRNSINQPIKVMPHQGDIFLVPLEGGGYAIGQVIRLDERGLLCISCGLFNYLVSSQDPDREFELDEKQCISTLLVTPRSFHDDRWPIVQKRRLAISKKHYPSEMEQRKGGIGAKVLDPEIVENFVAAYHGRKPWDMYFKPDYFDSMLLDKTRKPTGLIYKK